MIEVLRAPAFATIQDGGRPGFRRSGVPPGGAMDRRSLHFGNALLGNDWNAPAIEWALTGGELRFSLDCAFTLTGAVAALRLNGDAAAMHTVQHAHAGDTLTVERIERGRFFYVCVAGGIDVPAVLGGRGTYLPAGFGGLEGRRLQDGDMLSVTTPARHAVSSRTASSDHMLDSKPIGVLRGPQADALSSEAWETLFARELTVAAESDRAGYRLSGADLVPQSVPSGRSEPACVGAIQLTPDGRLIALMPDGPTVGGYPKVAVVTTADLPRLAQRQVGERVRFRLLDQSRALAELRAQNEWLRALSV